MAKAANRPGSQSDVGKLEAGKLWDDGKEPNVKLLMAIAAVGGRDLDHFREQSGADENRLALDRKLAVLEWLEESARRLREEVTGAPSGEGDLEAAHAVHAAEDGPEEVEADG